LIAWETVTAGSAAPPKPASHRTSSGSRRAPYAPATFVARRKRLQVRVRREYPDGACVPSGVVGTLQAGRVDKPT
jgi:hypothetical protein